MSTAGRGPSSASRSSPSLTRSQWQTTRPTAGSAAIADGTVHGLGRSSPTNDVNLANSALRESVESVFADIRRAEFIHGFRQNAADVGCDVSLADNHGDFPAQIEGMVPVVRMPVEPADEFGCGMTAGEILPGYAHAAIGLCTAGQDDCMVMGSEFRDGHIAAECDIPQEPESRAAGDAVVDLDNLLELWVVRCNAAADQSEGCRQAFKHIDLQREPGSQQRFRRIKAAGSAADDGNLQRLIRGVHGCRVSCGVRNPVPSAEQPPLAVPVAWR